MTWRRTPLPDFQAICLTPNRGNPTSPSRGEVLASACRRPTCQTRLSRLGAKVLPLALGSAVFDPSPLGGEGQGEG